MAIHNALHIANTEYPNKPTHILIDYFNGLYIIKIQMKILHLYNIHPNKTILEEIVKLLQNHICPFFLYKVYLHANIEINKKAKKLAKEGKDKEH